MTEADIGGLRPRGFLIATVLFTLIACATYLALPFQKGTPPTPPAEVALARDVGVLQGRLDEAVKAQQLLQSRLEAIEAAVARRTSRPRNDKSKQRP